VRFPRILVTPLACISLMMGRTLAANASAISLRALMEARRHPAFRALGQSHDGIAVIDREQAPVYDAARSGAQRPAFS
jgi:hypothetical protein